MSEQAPTRCECGRCEAVVRHEEACVVMGVDLPARDVPMWVCMADTPDEEVLDYFTDGAGCAYCESCGTEMSFNTTGQPVTRRMVPADETEADVAETPQAEYHRLLLAQATWLATNAHAAGKHKVSLHALLTALGEPEDKSLAERIVFLEMEWHDHWSFLIPEYHAGYPAEEHTRSDVAAIIAGRASEMVPRAALAWLVGTVEGWALGCPPARRGNGICPRYAEEGPNAENRPKCDECWIEAAIAAAKEAGDDE